MTAAAAHPLPEKLALSVNEAARLAGISRALIYPIVMSGELRSFKVGGRRLIAVADLQRWIDAQAAGEG